MRPERPDWEWLQRRIDGHLALPGSPAYQTAPPAFNARFRDIRPSAFTADPDDRRELMVQLW